MEEVVKKGFSMKILVLIIAVLIIIGEIIGIIILDKNSNKVLDKDNKNDTSIGEILEEKNDEFKSNVIRDEYFDETNPIPVKKNGKYGYISSDGTELTDFIYETAFDYIGEYAVVRLDNSYKIIDRNGNVKYSDSEHVIHFDDKYGNYVIDGKLYDLKLEKITDDDLDVSGYTKSGYYSFDTYSSRSGKNGIINSYGEIVYESTEGVSLFDVSNEYNNVYGIVGIYNFRNNGYDYIILDMLTGNTLYKAGDKEKIETNKKGIFLIKDENDVSYKVVAIKDGKVVADVETPNVSSAWWGNGKFDTLVINYSDNTTKYYDVNKKKLNDTGDDNYPGTATANLENLVFSNYIVTRGDANTTGITTSDGKEIVPNNTFVNLMTSSVDSYKYILNNYNKIYVLASNLNNAKMYDLVSGKVLYEESDVSGVYVSSDSLFGCMRTSFYLGFSPELIGVSTIFNLHTGEKMKFDVPESVHFRKTYFSIVKDNKTIYYNSKFNKIYEVENN